ncbi:hypothetical protein [Poseidonocella sp. HB161398]|uniref:hypothetical protein n=1 Tax=Poseidonocella sp. HB161398 TaxID=2320855 RepID=UPI00110875E7|nr:hypothetical protein [Poseidonocella sp. HB161398]
MLSARDVHAAACAVWADRGFAAPGLPDVHEAEGRDRSELDLPGRLRGLPDSLAAISVLRLVAMRNGSAVTAAARCDRGKAIVGVWWTGRAEDEAMADPLRSRRAGGLAFPPRRAPGGALSGWHPCRPPLMRRAEPSFGQGLSCIDVASPELQVEGRPLEDEAGFRACAGLCRIGMRAGGRCRSLPRACAPGLEQGAETGAENRAAPTLPAQRKAGHPGRRAGASARDLQRAVSVAVSGGVVRAALAALFRAGGLAGASGHGTAN